MMDSSCFHLGCFFIPFASGTRRKWFNVILILSERVIAAIKESIAASYLLNPANAIALSNHEILSFSLPLKHQA